MSKHLTVLASGLTPQQEKLAQDIVDNEFMLLSDDGKKLTNEELAERAGISPSTLYEWKRKPEFRRKMTELADAELETHRAEVYQQLLKAIRGTSNNGSPSVKALDLYMRRFGLLTTVIDADVTARPAPPRSAEEIARDIAELDAMVNKN